MFLVTCPSVTWKPWEPVSSLVVPANRPIEISSSDIIKIFQEDGHKLCIDINRVHACNGNYLLVGIILRDANLVNPDGSIGWQERKNSP